MLSRMSRAPPARPRLDPPARGRHEQFRPALADQIGAARARPARRSPCPAPRRTPPSRSRSRRRCRCRRRSPPKSAPSPLRIDAAAISAIADSATRFRSSKPSLPVRSAAHQRVFQHPPGPLRRRPRTARPARPASPPRRARNAAVSARTLTSSRSISSSIGKHLLQPRQVVAPTRAGSASPASAASTAASSAGVALQNSSGRQPSKAPGQPGQPRRGFAKHGPAGSASAAASAPASPSPAPARPAPRRSARACSPRGRSADAMPEQGRHLAEPQPPVAPPARPARTAAPIPPPPRPMPQSSAAAAAPRRRP